MAIEIIDTLKQKNNSDFAVVECNDLQGGYHQVATMDELEQISIKKKKQGMLCYVDSAKRIYRLEGDNWVEFVRAKDISIDDEENYFTATTLEGALIEMAKRLQAIESVPVIRAMCGEFLAGEVLAGQGFEGVEMSKLVENQALIKDLKTVLNNE